MPKTHFNKLKDRYRLSGEKGILFCLFEAISNSLYACINNEKILIEININTKKNTSLIKEESSENEISLLTIKDNGIGFNDSNFNKFIDEYLESNHDCGKGEGRISFLKVFKNVKIKSSFQEEDSYFYREFDFIENALDNKIISEKKQIETEIIFSNINDEFSKKYRGKEIVANEIIKHFYIFLRNLNEKNKKFAIKIIENANTISNFIINNANLEEAKVDTSYFNLVECGTNYDFEIIHIKTKIVDTNNAFYVVDERAVSKIENLDLPKMKFYNENDGDYYYQLYLYSNYFKENLNEFRTELNLQSRKKCENISQEFIYKEDIEEKVQKEIQKHLKYEFEKLKEDKYQKINIILNKKENNIVNNDKSLLYILENEDTKEILLEKIKFNSTENQILKTIKNFHEEIKKETKNKIDDLNKKIKTKEFKDVDKIKDEIMFLTNKVNIENLVELSSYILYRKYIIDLLDKSLKFYSEETTTQNEDLFHNILFQKKTNNSFNSNMWIFNEQFLYFEGVSEIELEKVEIDGKKLLKELNPEEKELLNEFGKQRTKNRFDLLFFPEEGECLIIELKDPKEIGTGSEQIYRYINIIAKYLNPNTQINNFYAYLVLENFNELDIPSGYEPIYGINAYRSHTKLRENKGNLYREIIKYSDLINRASKRNKIFLDKLINKKS